MPETAAIGLLLAVLAAVVAGLVVQRRRLARTEERLIATESVRDALAERERELLTDASHQLRTPATALRLILEDLSAWPETTPAMQTELGHAAGEIARWDRALDHVLGADRDRRSVTASEIDLAELLHDTLQRRVPGGRAKIRSRSAVCTFVDREALTDLVTVLLDHVDAVAGEPYVIDLIDLGSHVQVRIDGDGGRDRVLRDAPLDPLPGAGALAAALGGYLQVPGTPNGRVVLTLPPGQHG